MIFIMRHQQGENETNCLSLNSVKKMKSIAQKLSKVESNNNEFKVYTITPREYKHIRPVQTASNLCTYLQSSLKVHNCYENVIDSLSKYIDTHNIIIVWHHSEIPEMLTSIQYTYSLPDGKPIHWSNDNYDGCVLINPRTERVVFDEFFFRKKRTCF